MKNSKSPAMYLAGVMMILGLGACEAQTQANGEAAAETSATETLPPEAAGATTADAACWMRSGSQALAERGSTLDSATVMLDAGELKVCYGRPQMRGREIMGGLVPFDQPWRTGANEATSIHMPAAGTIAGVAVEPGWYSLYTVPGADAWEVVVNGERERWGIPINEEVRAQDVGSATVAVESSGGAPVESLTMSLDRTSGTTADLVIEWETTRVSLPISLGG
jgi:hypothetical protein